MAILIERKRKRRRKAPLLDILNDQCHQAPQQQQHQQQAHLEQLDPASRNSAATTMMIPSRSLIDDGFRGPQNGEHWRQASCSSLNHLPVTNRKAFKVEILRQHCKVRLTKTSKSGAIVDKRGFLPLFLLSLLSSLLLSIAFTSILSANLIQFVAASGSSGNQQLKQQQQQSVSFQNQHHHSIGTSTPVIMAPQNVKARYKTMYACEDRQLTIDCDFGSKINLIRANYGRFSITQCNEQGQLDLSVDCMSPIALRIMHERCQDKQKCSVNATSTIFGDRCPKTRKYLEVHFQCQTNLDPIDSVNLSTLPTSTTLLPPISVFPSGPGQTFNPNHPKTIVPSPPRPDPAPYQPPQDNSLNQPSPTWRDEPVARPQTQQMQPLVNSDVVNFNSISKSGYYNPSNTPQELIFVALRHRHLENMSNPRCHQWDQATQKWTEKGGRMIQTNQTHTVCAFDQPTSYLLVMDYPISSSPSDQVSDDDNNHKYDQHRGRHLVSNFSPIKELTDISIGSLTTIQSHPNLQIEFNQPIDEALVPYQPSPPPVIDQNPIEFLNRTPTELVPLGPTQQIKDQSPPSQIMSLFSLLGYLLFFVGFIAVAFITIAFIALNRSSAGAALKSLGNFTAFNGPKYKGRRSDGPLHNKDLLVINNQNGHQFLYAPASTTKINSSSSTHILANGASGNQHQRTLHQIQQQQMYSGNGTLSNLSGTGGQSNNYYYGLMGLTNLFQQQQQQQQQSQTMQHHLSQHHLNQQQQQVHQIGQLNHQTQLAPTSYHHQANKSTISDESANSTPSSSGVESGSTSMQNHHQQACLLMNNEYNLMGGQVNNCGQHQSLLSGNPTGAIGHQPMLTLNAHYSSSGFPMNLANSNINQLGQQRMNVNLSNTASMREHIYESVDDDKPYTARLLLPISMSPGDHFNSNTLSQHQSMNLQQQQQQQQQQMNSSAKAMTLSSRLIQQQQQQQQQQQSNQQQLSQTKKRLFSHPAIVRDSRQTKTNIVCSKQAQVMPQRAMEINNKFQHDVMTIYNDDTTTATTATASNSTSSGYGGRSDGLVESLGKGKLSTDC